VAFAALQPLRPRLDPSTVLRLHRQDRSAWHGVMGAMSRLAKRAKSASAR
jgi:hypothetical protein